MDSYEWKIDLPKPISLNKENQNFFIFDQKLFDTYK